MTADEVNISVIIPVYNSGEFITDAIESILNQKPLDTVSALPTLEIIVVDDLSTDTKTLEILEHYKNQLFATVRVIKNSRLKGVAGARNSGVYAAKGQWIAFLDSDDIWFPYSLALRWEAIEKNQEIRWLAAKFNILRATVSIETEKAKSFLSTKELFKNLANPKTRVLPRRIHNTFECFSKECFTGIMTVLVHRSLILEKGLFDENLRRAEDYHLWLKCAIDQDLYFLDIETAFYRIHSASLTHGDAPKYQNEDVMIDRLLAEGVSDINKSLLLKRLDLVMQDHCYFYREKGDFSSGMTYALRWLKSRPTRFNPWKEILACTLRIT